MRCWFYFLLIEGNCEVDVEFIAKRIRLRYGGMNMGNGKMLLCQRHPVFYFLSVWEKRTRRAAKWLHPESAYASTRVQDLPVNLKSHQSVLVRKLGTSDPQLQINKITNLRIACQYMSGIAIKPGETFSFWRLIGLPTKRKGYLDGMLLAKGQVMVGVGGGLCQLANLLHWMVLHTPLTIIERHHHGFDPFPDDGRVLPYGSGATVFYNYVDLQFRNDTPHTFQVKVWVTDKHLKGEIRCSERQEHSYSVFEREHAFVKQGDTFYRKNEIWRNVISRRTGAIEREELVTKNFAEVRYSPDTWEEQNHCD